MPVKKLNQFTWNSGLFICNYEILHRILTCKKISYTASPAETPIVTNWALCYIVSLLS